MTGRWGPDRRQAAVSLTFDHLGEAAELENGTWPAKQPIGKHHTVTGVLPQVLHALAEHQVPATFFVEAWNALTYPEVLGQISDAGHEVACHGYRHENWSALDRAEIEQLLIRSSDAYHRAGLDAVVGLRPPGPVSAALTAPMLEALGWTYLSLPAVQESTDGGVALLNLPWHGIDAVYYQPQFAYLRVPPGDGAQTPAQLLQAFDVVIDDAVATGGHTSLAFHLHLQDSNDKLEAIAQLAARLARDPRLWVTSCRDVASWKLQHLEVTTAAGLA